MSGLRRFFSPLLFLLFGANLLATSFLFTCILYVGQKVLPQKLAALLSCKISWILGNQVLFLANWVCNMKMVLYYEEGTFDSVTEGNYIINMSHRYEYVSTGDYIFTP